MGEKQKGPESLMEPMKSHRKAHDRCPGFPLGDVAESCGKRIKATQVLHGETVPHYWCVVCRKKRAAEIEREQRPPAGIGPTVDNLVRLPKPQISADRYISTRKIP